MSLFDSLGGTTQQPQRMAMQNAMQQLRANPSAMLKQAGLNVLQMLPEPVAAALFYGIRQSGQTKTIAVYDLGGGTFDATLVRIEENSFQILDFDGRKTLGGADWDQKIIDWCIDQAVEESGISRESITDDADAMAELRAMEQ